MFVEECRGEANRLGFALLLKSLQHLGYFPEKPEEIPYSVKVFIAKQLKVPEQALVDYAWSSRTRDNHLALIREETGFRFASGADKKQLEDWLSFEGTKRVHTHEDLIELALGRLSVLKIELPTEGELRRIVGSAINSFFQKVYRVVSARLLENSRQRLDELIVVADGESQSTFDQLKREPGQAGVDNLGKEIAKLQKLKSMVLPTDLFGGIPGKVIELFERRAKNERPSELRAHPDHVRYTLLASFVHIRTGEVTDDIIKMFMDIIHRMDAESEDELDRQLLSDLKKVEGKVQMLFRIANAVVKEPGGTIREVIFPEVGEKTFQELVAEYDATGARFRTLQQKLMRRKYVYHYRRMLPLVLENLTFRSNNQYQPIIDALNVIKQYMDTDLEYFPEDVPIEGVVSPSWEKSVIHHVDGEQKVNRKMYELCALQKAKKGLKCREVWEERARDYRNPDEDMPPEWSDQAKRTACYVSLNQPVEAAQFIESERRRMTEALAQFNNSLPDNEHVRITGRHRNQGRGQFSVDKLKAQEEPENLKLIKQSIKERFGMIELLDVMVEADRLTDFSRFFTHSGTKEIRSREALRPLLILDLFAEATNTGIARVAKANDEYSYEEMYYVRRNYIWREPLRNANSAIVNKILEIRHPTIWGHGHACASDGKSFSSWNRNLLSEWRTRYKGYGVMAYWHVETNAVCIYSQLKNYSPSEVAAMIEGLIRHDTEMRVDKNFVDSHGQSEVAFAFARLLNSFKLVPRLKRIKNERLYLPGKGMADSFPNLAGVLTRPIRWSLIEHQYDEMIKATIAMRDGHASADAILRRFNSYNRQHPTYKALIELGKAEKTIFLPGWLSSLEARQETNEGLNVVENWNNTTDFVSYGSHGELATNNREDQEITVLSLQLLQNCMMLINTILVQRILEDDALFSRLTPADLRGLTPLFYGHINPYGLFYLDLEQPSFLEAA